MMCQSSHDLIKDLRHEAERIIREGGAPSIETTSRALFRAAERIEYLEVANEALRAAVRETFK